MSRGYIFAVWAGVRKVASADNRSIFYRACAKFITRFASKINRQQAPVVRSVVKWREFRGNNKIALTLICYAKLTQCSKLVKNRKNPVFKFIRADFWTDLNGCRQRLLFARQLTQRKCSLCSQQGKELVSAGQRMWSVPMQVKLKRTERIYVKARSASRGTEKLAWVAFYLKKSVLWYIKRKRKERKKRLILLKKYISRTNLVKLKVPVNIQDNCSRIGAVVWNYNVREETKAQMIAFTLSLVVALIIKVSRWVY